MKTQATSRPQMTLTTQLGRRDIMHSCQGYNSIQAGYTQLARSTGVNVHVSVMVLQGCKSTPRKQTKRDMLCKYSY